MLIDSHCHLDYLQREGRLEQSLANARAGGVARMLSISTKLATFPDILRIAEAEDDVWCTIGVHPHECEKAPLVLDDLLKACDHDKVIGIGETGLDYYYEHSPRDLQQEYFRIHIEAARQTGLPLIVHTRDADADTMRILEEETGKGAFPFLIHCFSSSLELAEKAVSLGGYVSLSGIITFKKADAVREASMAVPLERLLVETDSPYLAPVPFRGKPNEPAHVRLVAEKLAQMRGLDSDEICEITGANFMRLFTKAARGG